MPETPEWGNATLASCSFFQLGSISGGGRPDERGDSNWGYMLGQTAMNTDSATLIILGSFALIALVLMLMRSLMDHVGKTIEAWRKLRNTWRGGGEPPELPSSSIGVPNERPAALIVRGMGSPGGRAGRFSPARSPQWSQRRARSSTDTDFASSHLA